MNSPSACVSIFCLLLLLLGCGDETTVKPSAMLRLQYPMPEYQTIDTNCPYSFQANRMATIDSKADCAINLHYSKMKATVYLTYQQIDGNLEKLLQDAQKLTFDHTVKASEIFEQPRVDSIQNVYGMFYMINGDAATQSQFYATDSIGHFLSGSLYFEAKPNYDSLYPAVEYLRNDMRRLMETLTWE